MSTRGNTAGPASLGRVSPSDLLASLHDRWNARDADGFADLFDATGVSIGFDGSTEVGARTIAEHLAAIFADHVPAQYIGARCHSTYSGGCESSRGRPGRSDGSV